MRLKPGTGESPVLQDQFEEEMVELRCFLDGSRLADHRDPYGDRYCSAGDALLASRDEVENSPSGWIKAEPDAPGL
jgi:hypothetical protein